MASPQQQDKKIGFKAINICKDQTLGIGAYGAVYKAKCDDLLCAAKIIHPTLFDPTALHQIPSHREHRLPIRRFQQECEFLSTVRHPNIVQYLGTHQDPDTGQPVLLMELMDDSLTHFLETSVQPIPYYIQVNICHDITLVLSFLHSNFIIHRDLSSNNVLLNGNIRAKLTDFGMARLGELTPHGFHVTNTMCPGTDVYMPPEAVQDTPVYTEKIDCFSFGVIMIQILTREFPKPGDRMTTVHDAHYPQGALKLCIPETERRRNHISQINPNDPLLLIALDCLKDKDIERPSAQQLCERVSALKETSKYKSAHERMKTDNGKDEHLHTLLEEKNHVIDKKEMIIVKKEEQLRQCREELQHVERDKDEIIQLLERERNQLFQEKLEKERELVRVNQRLEESERLVAEFGQRNIELEEQLGMRIQTQQQDNGASTRPVPVSWENIKLTWRVGEKAPCGIGRYCDAVKHNDIVYCMYAGIVSNIIYAYNIPSSNWSSIPDCPQRSGLAISVIDGLLTTIGGYGHNFKNTNKLLSLIAESSDRKWSEEFPPMPTKRSCVAALCTGTSLIVAGGSDDNSAKLKIVEVLNTDTQQWHTAPDLSEPLANPSLTLCDDLVYLLGGFNNKDSATTSVYSSSLSSLLSSTGSKSLGGHLASILKRSSKGSTSLWNKVADLPVTLSTSISLHGQLLAIGGVDAEGKHSTGVHVYDATTNSWQIISHMTTPRSKCIAAILPDNQLMVIGGRTDTSGTNMKFCDSVEFGRVILN